MMQNNKVIIYWSSLEASDKRIIKIAFIILPLILMLIHSINISKKILASKASLAVAERNFNYVYDKALNFQEFTLAQEAKSRFPEINDFIFSESQRFKLVQFQLGQEGDRAFISFEGKSIPNYSEFLESLESHPSISIKFLSIIPQNNLYQVKVYFE